MEGVKEEWKDEIDKCERHERWFDDENTIMARAQGGTTFCFGFLKKTRSSLGPISSIIYLILSIILSVFMHEARVSERVCTEGACMQNGAVIWPCTVV